jgi:outer membrane protein assembly factor BamB
VVIILLQAAVIFLPPLLLEMSPLLFTLRFFAPVAAFLAVAIWWLFASRLRWRDRFLVLGTYVVAAGATFALCDRSAIMALLMYVLPITTSAWVIWLLVTPFLSWTVRRAVLVVFLFLAWTSGNLARVDGVDGSFSAELSWRWSPTPEQRYQAQPLPNLAPRDETVTLEAGDWPGFRGSRRDGRLTGVRIGTDWGAHPPRQVWRHRVGPGWGSFAVVGRRLFTQEQRGENELVVCYNTDTGDPLWIREEPGRFVDTMSTSGVGPRATPTFHEGKLYVMTGVGRLLSLDAATGRVIWECNAAADAGAEKPPQWGFASSPLVLQGVVTVYTGFEPQPVNDDKQRSSVLAYDAASGGKPLWTWGNGRHAYTSPHPAKLGGMEQILIASNVGLTGLDPRSGRVLWQYSPEKEADMPRCVQPALVSPSDVLLGTGFVGDERITLGSSGSAAPEVQTRWTSRALRPYFNDRVVHNGYVYGFDEGMFTCVSVEDGKAAWRGGRYGSGQVLLLADQDLLLVLSEKGDVVLVKADPKGHQELGRFHALDGKTWNHPVIAHGKLFVRNGEEAACYELAVASAGAGSGQ